MKKIVLSALAVAAIAGFATTADARGNHGPSASQLLLNLQAQAQQAKSTSIAVATGGDVVASGNSFNVNDNTAVSVNDNTNIVRGTIDLSAFQALSQDANNRNTSTNVSVNDIEID